MQLDLEPTDHLMRDQEVDVCAKTLPLFGDCRKVRFRPKAEVDELHTFNATPILRMTVYGLLLGLQAIRLIAMRCDCVRISGLVSWHTLMPGHNGYPRVGSQLLSRAFRTWSFTGLAGAGSTCSPSVSLLCNRA